MSVRQRKIAQDTFPTGIFGIAGFEVYIERWFVSSN